MKPRRCGRQRCTVELPDGAGVAYHPHDLDEYGMRHRYCSGECLLADRQEAEARARTAAERRRKMRDELP